MKVTCECGIAFDVKNIREHMPIKIIEDQDNKKKIQKEFNMKVTSDCGSISQRQFKSTRSNRKTQNVFKQKRCGKTLK